MALVSFIRQKHPLIQLAVYYAEIVNMCDNNYVYMNRRGELIKPLAHGEKAVFVSNFNTKTTIHIRRYFGESDKMFLICYGITLTRQRLST